MDLLTLKRALGGDVVGHEVLCPGPGHGAKDRSLAVKLTSDGFVVYSHAGDDWQECADYVRERLGWPRWQPGDGRKRRITPARVAVFDRAVIDAETEDRRERSDDDRRRISNAVAIWEAAIDPRDTLAEKYLASRSLTLAADVAGAVLRFHLVCPWRDENTGSTIRVPALIAAFRSIDDGQVVAIQRIALTADGGKIGRRMLGLVHRAAIMLDPPGEELHIGEGVETCLAARQLGHAPAWALGSVGMIAKFPVLDGVAWLRVLGEEGKASADAVGHVGRRWHAAGRKVQVVMPDDGCDDLNTELMRKAAAA
jgi:putative DNA primase/helicase